MSEKKAFTLMEMLIVIAIIAILAVLAVNAYGGARRSAQIDLTADGLVSALKMQQGLSKSGRIDADSGNISKCYGIYFSKDVDESQTQIQYVDTPYYSVHPDRPEADVCDLAVRTMRKYEADADFELFMIEKFDQEADELLILFKPPFARVVLGNLTNVSSPSGNTLSPFIKFGVRLPNGDNEKFVRFDTSTGLIERVYGEQA